VLKRIAMAGADVAVTDERIAVLVIEYAKLLGRAGTTDTVVLPVVADGVADEALLLLGPASQITVTSNHDPNLEGIRLPTTDQVADDLTARIKALTGAIRPDRSECDETDEDPLGNHFPDFDTYGP
jgi:hypothetical protein